jgi:uncharacterized protein (DUF433 family)
MARYALNLPGELQRDAERLAAHQGVSLDQFILWSVAEKVGALKRGADDPQFPGIVYRYGASGVPTPVLRGTGLRVQTFVIDVRQGGMTPAQAAAEYDLPEARVVEALAFYDAHQSEIDAHIAAESALAEPHA